LKLFLVICVGIVASFGLTVFAEVLWLNSASRVWRIHPEFFCIPVIVGGGVGLAVSRKAKLAAALSLAPWGLTMILGANTGRPSLSHWAISIVLVSAYSMLGVGAAELARRVINRSDRLCEVDGR
jgi:hypothetical protein